MRTTTMHTTMSLVTVLSMAGVATAGQSDLRLVNAAAEHRMETVRALLDADVDVNRAPLDWACAWEAIVAVGTTTTPNAHSRTTTDRSLVFTLVICASRSKW